MVRLQHRHDDDLSRPSNGATPNHRSAKNFSATICIPACGPLHSWASSAKVRRVVANTRGIAGRDNGRFKDLNDGLTKTVMAQHDFPRRSRT